MASLLIYFLLCIQISAINAQIPDGFILDVEPNCGDGSPGSYATITVKSDMYVKIHVDCGSGDAIYTIGHKEVKADIKVYYGVDSGSTGNCYFKVPDVNSGLSTVKLIMYYGLHENNILGSKKEKYTVSCLSKATQKSDSGISNKIKGYNPRNVVRNEGGTLSGSVDFHIVTILDQQIDGQAIPLGRRVQLKAHISVSGGNIQVTDCLAKGKDDNSINYQILNSGCGDGIVIPETLGFTANSGVIRSPYFSLFQLDQDSGLLFSCNFTGCISDCDGSSCTDAARKKRSIQNEESRVTDLVMDQSDGLIKVKDDEIFTITSKSYAFTKDSSSSTKPRNISWTKSTTTIQFLLLVTSGFVMLFLMSVSILIYVCRKQRLCARLQ